MGSSSVTSSQIIDDSLKGFIQTLPSHYMYGRKISTTSLNSTTTTTATKTTTTTTWATSSSTNENYEVDGYLYLEASLDEDLPPYDPNQLRIRVQIFDAEEVTLLPPCEMLLEEKATLSTLKERVLKLNNNDDNKDLNQSVDTSKIRIYKRRKILRWIRVSSWR